MNAKGPNAEQHTIAHPVKVSGAGLHTGRRSMVTLLPAEADTGRRIAAEGRKSVDLSWRHWRPSAMSTSISLGDDATVRTIEHMMAALTAYGVDNVLVQLSGSEIPILDGSAEPWCRHLDVAGLKSCGVPRRLIRVRKCVQIERDGGFLRAEPHDGFAVDVTHDVLPTFPLMRWHGAVEAERFRREIARSRSFGNLHRRLGLSQDDAKRPASISGLRANLSAPACNARHNPWPAIAARKADQSPGAPLLKGWRPWRATLIVGRRILPRPRFSDEPVRHVTLDMIGDLSLAGRPLLGRFVAHNPSHEKTYALVAALMADKSAWELV